MTPIYIVGSGGAGKEIFLLISSINRVEPSFEFRGFIDFEEGEILIGDDGYRIHAEQTFISKMPDPSSVALAIGVGGPVKIQRIADKYDALGFQFPNLIHPSVEGRWSSIRMGKGNLICAGSLFELDIQLGSFNFFNLNSVLCHDCRVGSYNVFSPRTTVCGTVHVGDANLFGCSATVLPNIGIGDRNTIGAGAVVTRTIGDHHVMVGVPARVSEKTKT